MKFDNIFLTALLLFGLTAVQRPLRAAPPPDFDPFEKTYKITEEAQAPALTMESAKQVSPSYPFSNLLKDNRVTWLVMCNRSCENLRETLRHVAEWMHRYGEFGAKAYAFLHHASGAWPDLASLQEDFGQEVIFITGQDVKNLEALMTAWEVDVSPVVFVSTAKGFLMGRMTGYSPKDLNEWNDYFADMFRPLIRQKLQGAPSIRKETLEPPEDPNYPDEQDGTNDW